jgi:hypothetical protein
VDDLVRWLGAQLDEDERVARGCSGTAWREHPKNWVSAPNRVALVVHDGDRSHVVRHDPARVLREIDAKREIVRQHVPVGDGTVCLSYCHTRKPGEAQAWPCLTLRLLALPYSDRPGYRDEWKPSKLYRAGTPGIVDYEEAP